MKISLGQCKLALMKIQENQNSEEQSIKPEYLPFIVISR